MVTVTAHVAFAPLPSAAVQVMVAVPADTAVTTPLLFTVATLVFVLLHVSSLFVAFEGETVAVSAEVSPSVMESDVLLRVIEVTYTTFAFTVTSHVAFTPLPSAAVQVMVAVPADTAVTTPLLFTVATLVFVLLHVTLLFVAFEGETVAVSVEVSPSVSESEEVLKVMDDTRICDFCVTVMEME